MGRLSDKLSWFKAHQRLWNGSSFSNGDYCVQRDKQTYEELEKVIRFREEPPISLNLCSRESEILAIELLILWMIFSDLSII